MTQTLLRPLAQEDAPLIARAFSDIRVTRFLEEVRQPYTLEDAKAFVFFAAAKASSGRDFAVSADGAFAGMMSLVYGAGRHACECELGYWLLPEYWNQGIASRAIRLAADFAFEKRGLERVFARSYEKNAASCRALEKAGFEPEAVLRRSALLDGAPENVRLYALLNPLTIV